MSKKFCILDFKMWDSIAREEAKSFLFCINTLFHVQDNPDIYGPDLILTLPSGDKVYVECEVKVGWKTKHFPFDTVRIAGRKEKFIEQDRPTFFIVFNSSLDSLFLIDQNALSNAARIFEVSKFSEGKPELFLDLPVSYAQKFEKGDASEVQALEENLICSFVASVKGLSKEG